MMQPPTDNLYKFLAIFGLVIVGFSIYIPLQRLERFDRSSMQADIAYQPIIEKLMVVSDSAMADLECAISKAEEREQAKVTNAAACEKASEIRAFATRANEELKTLRAAAASREHERKLLYKQYHTYLTIGILGGFIGTLLCVVGFWLWYVRLQRFLDAAAKRDA